MKSKKIKLGLLLLAIPTSITATLITSCVNNSQNSIFNNKLSLEYASQNMSINLGFTDPNTITNKTINNMSMSQVSDYLDNLNIDGESVYNEVNKILDLSAINNEQSFIDQFNDLNLKDQENLINSSNKILNVFEKDSYRFSYKYRFLWATVYLTNNEARDWVRVFDALSNLGALSDITTGVVGVDIALKIGGILGAGCTLISQSISNVIKSGSGAKIVLLFGIIPICYHSWM